MSRILARSVAKGSFSAQDRAYLAQLVSQRTGMSQQEAEKRVDEAVTAARQAADKARRAAILTGFVTADGDAMGRPVGVAVDRRGALLVADDVGNTVWRVSAAR